MFLPSNITLQFGDSGDFVAELQRRLAQMGHFAHDQINGFFDGGTVNAVSAFQAASGLRADGIAGPETLRRLNGAISGDTSGGTDNKTEEEVKPLAAAPQPEPLWMAPPAAPDAALIEAIRRDAPAEPILAAAPAIEPIRELPREPVQSAQHGDPVLAQMLMDRPAPAAQPQHQPQAESPRVPLEQRPPLQAQAAPHEPQAQHTEAAHTAPAQAPQAAPAAGLMQKTKQFASEMMQKLGNYFESKLAPSVLNEVRDIGQSMMKNGVKEAPIPTSPDLPSRGPELPSRGAEQAPALQRK
jgi:hypothetical protein